MMEKINNKKYIVLLLIIGAVYFFLRYISPLVAPIIVAVLFLTMFYPTLDDIQKITRIKKQFLATIFILLLGIFIITVAWILLSLAVQHTPSIGGSLEDFQQEITSIIEECATSIEATFGFEVSFIEEAIIEKINIFVDDFQGEVLPEIINQTWSYAKSIISVGGFIVITVIATILLAKDYDEILDKVAIKEESRVILVIVVRVIQYIATFIKAQMLIMLSIGSLAVITLSIAGIPQGVMWGLLAGVLDALPFIGTGIVLVPLAIWNLIQGMYGKAVVCLVLYAMCALIRECMEPRLIGAKVGVYPVGILVAVYAGLKLFGLGGIFLGPIGLVIVQQIYKSYLGYDEEETRI